MAKAKANNNSSISVELISSSWYVDHPKTARIGWKVLAFPWFSSKIFTNPSGFVMWSLLSC